jgi:N-acyl-D-amino-acid deacylase
MENGHFQLPPDVREIVLAGLTTYLGRGDQIVGYSRSGRHVGQRTADLAAAAGKSMGEFAFDLLMEEEGAVTMVYPWQTPVEEHERVIADTVVHPRMMVASDGVYDVPHPHPRSFGCFARVLGEFVRERGLVSLPEAVYKMAGFPAERFRVPDRGVIRAGAAADLAVFDAETVAARSTWDDPRREAVGMHWVLVNGRPIIADGTPTGALPGRVLART